MKSNMNYWAYVLAWKITRLLPEKMIYQNANRVADRIYKKNGKSVKRLRSNYARIQPELIDLALEELVKAGMRSYLRYWCDTFRFPNWSKERVLSTVTVQNEHYLTDPITKGIGCIVSLPHAGNWDHAGAYFCTKGIPLTTVAEHLEPEKLFRKFLTYRQNMGMEVLDLDSRVIATLAQRLRAGKMIALVADRDLSRSGVNVNFAGGPARMPGGPALLALQTGAPLITAYVKYEELGIRIIFEGPIPIPEYGSQSEKVVIMTQACADRFATHIKSSTSDWHMLQRIWVDGDFHEIQKTNE
jgi:lauroyl/myristoyl acyltransferase